jgi:hypothetical protein
MKFFFMTLIFSVNSAFAFEGELKDVVNQLDISSSAREFIQDNVSHEDFLTESCPTMEACSDYFYHSKTYKFRGDAKTVFKKLISQSGPQIWNGTSQFDLVYDSDAKTILDRSSNQLPSVALGQIYFLELNIVRSMQIPVAFKIVEIDEVELKLGFSYLKRNKSNGIQRLSFTQEGSHFLIKHETRFKSESNLRDRVLYRPFHKKLLNEFYDNFSSTLID